MTPERSHTAQTFTLHALLVLSLPYAGIIFCWARLCGAINTLLLWTLLMLACRQTPQKSWLESLLAPMAPCSR